MYVLTDVSVQWWWEPLLVRCYLGLGVVTRESRNGVFTFGHFAFGDCLWMVTKISERRGDTCITNCKCKIISLASFLSSPCHKCFERRSYWRLLWHRTLIAIPYTQLNYLMYINLKLAFLVRVQGFFLLQMFSLQVVYHYRTEVSEDTANPLVSCLSRIFWG